MKTKFAVYAALLLMNGVALVDIARAGCPCNGCGFERRCRIVCELKPRVTMDHCMTCDEMCLLAPSKCCGKRYVPDCFAWLGFRRDAIQKPCGGNYTRTVRTAWRMPVEEMVPTYKCVVEKYCRGCGVCCASHVVAADQAQRAIDQARSQNILPVQDQQAVLLPWDADAQPWAR